MTAEPIPAGGDPHRMLAHVRHLTRRVRVAQRVTWLPLLVLALVTFAAIPFHRYGTQVLGCTVIPNGQVCEVRNTAAGVYWLVALALSYVAIAYGYLRAARARGLGGRVMPYVVTGIALAVLSSSGLLLIVHEGWGRAIAESPDPPNGLTLFLFRVVEVGSTIGMALLVLAWLERHLALLLFTVGYLAVVLVPLDFGWNAHWGGFTWGFLPTLLVRGGVLLLGGLGFALAQRPWRHR
ncbi:hypothetical protein [Micromonospora costi]|uniref:Uncharacterized protein n=1 Tax=Micromonospora costi TaxID=1530042 RepID=A0A3A9ZY71_9ACTN|nr:hypothetical protein [Micromonospora costi]RKN53100.1 hypothetical protein D7193_25300 [Micromonospora costi]